jgi:nucleotide-binding universal stress UspA family protein
MKKILVTTDFSTHSKSGLRFAIQLAAQYKAELVFFHCFQALIPTTIYRERVANALQAQAEGKMQKLEKFITTLYQSMKIHPGAYQCVVVEDFNAEQAIIRHAQKMDADYICMSTRGAGSLMKLVGTNTSHVIQKSPIPVLVVPHNYRAQPIRRILYASDMENLEREMSLVDAFAQSLDVPVDLAHFFFPGKLPLDQKTLTKMWKQKYGCLNRIHLKQFNMDEGFTEQLGQLVNHVKPSLVVFFTHTNRSWFDKIFSSGRSGDFSFVTKKPMLVYRKG